MEKRNLKLADALADHRSKYGKYKWRIESNDYSKLEWAESNAITKPTEEELLEEVARLQILENYHAPTMEAFPTFSEQLDMLFHDMTAGKGTKDGEWYKAIAKVKTDNPKPTE